MKGFEEALAECLASLERGRSVEECLARYPELARELEPLLRTALGLQRTYTVGPRPSFQRAARQRFLAAARRRPRAVAPPPRHFSFGWRWAPAGLAAAGVAAAIALATVLALSRGGGSPDGGLVFETVVPTSTPAPSATETPPAPEPEEIDALVARAQEQLGQIQGQIDQGEVIPSETIQELKDINQSLEQSLREAPPEAVEAAPQIVGMLDEQSKLLSDARDQNQVAPEAADAVDEVIRIAGTVRDLLSPTATATPSPTPTPTPTGTGTPAPSSTATATQEASATATPASSPGPGSAGGETIVPLTPTPSP